MNTKQNSQIPQILIDCDPGADDFFALLWALGLHKKGVIRIHAITTTGGNVGADITYLNALRACEFMEVDDVKVGKGVSKNGSSDASHIHGSDGLGNASTYLPKVTVPKKALSSIDLISTTLEKYPETQILIFGPMTNIAKYVQQYNAIPMNRVIAMGGALQVPGNVTPVAEFNISYDPEAADTVLSQVRNSILLPLDVTSQIIFTRREMRSIIEKLPKSKAKFLEALTVHTFQTNMAFRETAGIEGFLVHDASVVAMLVHPHLFSGQFLPVRVETKGEYTRGQTVTDLRNIAQPTTHTFVCKKCRMRPIYGSDGTGFSEFFIKYTMYLISLIGGSGSGKGYLAEKIIAAVGTDRVSTIPMDMYYYPHDRFPTHLDVTLEGKTYKNFDTPEALEIDLLVDHLKKLQSGESIEIPHYDFGNNPTGKGQRTGGPLIEPRDFIILDGIFGLVDERIREMTDVSIFIDISPLNRMARRFVRDFGYGRTRAYMGSGLGDTIKFYVEYVEKGYQDYVEKYKEFADLVVNNDAWAEKGEEPKMVDITVNYLRGKYEKEIEKIIEQ